MDRHRIPVRFQPRHVATPWGGRRLVERFGRTVPADARIGELWELSPLPAAESRVAGGPHDGKSLTELIRAWGVEREWREPGGRAFPWLIKFLDAAENLSVQVHPRPNSPTANAADVKHEAWIVLQAEPQAEILVGLRNAVTTHDLAAAAGTRDIVSLLQRFPVVAGDCISLPSGVVHALGAGVCVVEVQSPSDVTYRMYDWDRVGSAGSLRPLHVAEALENILHDAHPSLQSAISPERAVEPKTTLVQCPAFLVESLNRSIRIQEAADGGPTVVIATTSAGKLAGEFGEIVLSAGNVYLLPPTTVVDWKSMPGMTLVCVRRPAPPRGFSNPE